MHRRVVLVGAATIGVLLLGALGYIRWQTERWKSVWGRSIDQLDAGRPDEAVRGFREAVGISEHALWWDARRRSAGLRFLADCEVELGDLGAAESLLARSHEFIERRFGTKDEELVHVQTSMGELMLRQGRSGTAESLFVSALKGAERGYGPVSDEVAFALAMLARTKESMGEVDASETLFRRSAKMYGFLHNSAGGDWIPPVQIEVLDAFALFLSDQRRFAESESLARIVMLMDSASEPDQATAVARRAHHLGAICLGAGRYVEAESLLQAALRVQLTRLGSKSPELAETQALLSLLHRRTGRAGAVDSSRARSALSGGTAIRFFSRPNGARGLAK